MALTWLPILPDGPKRRPARRPVQMETYPTVAIPAPIPVNDMRWLPMMLGRPHRTRLQHFAPLAVPPPPSFDLAWLPIVPVHVLRRRSWRITDPVIGVFPTVGQYAAWQPVSAQHQVRTRRPLTLRGGWLIEPSPTANTIGCLEWTDETIGLPRLTSETGTSPTLTAETCTLPAVTSEDLC